ncbi:hypothetical protein [Modestobacter lacusdianchii]
MHLSSHTPHLHLPALRLPGRLPVATVLLSVVYVAAIATALTTPGQHALAAGVVLAGLVSRTVVRRHRSTSAAVATATATVDTALPVGADRPVPEAAPATAAA